MPLPKTEYVEHARTLLKTIGYDKSDLENEAFGLAVKIEMELQQEHIDLAKTLGYFGKRKAFKLFREDRVACIEYLKSKIPDYEKRIDKRIERFNLEFFQGVSDAKQLAERSQKTK